MTMMGAVLIEVILFVVRVSLSLVGGVKYLQAIFEYARYGPNTGACAAECPKQIPLSVIATLNREYISAKMNGK